MDTNNKQRFLILIEQFLSGKASVSEIKSLFNFFQSHQEISDWEDEHKKVVEEKIYHNIQEKLGIGSFKRKKVISIFNTNLLKYAAVILLGGLLAYSVLNRDILSTSKDLELVENNIQIGTNKASLTLEDGSIVLLEKGKLYENRNVNSNGDEIVYNEVDAESVLNMNDVKYNYLTIPRGGQFLVKLSDNTKVWLNSESQLKYPINFIEGTSREVELIYGEAYFEVSPSALHNGDSFQVISRGQKVEVVGTQFNVKSYKDEASIYTTLVEGEVLVSHADTKQTLRPNQQYAFNILDHKGLISNVNVYNEVSWRGGVFSFENKSLKEIMTVLSRWYDMNVIFENKDIENVEFVGVLYKDRSIESILKNIKSVGSIKSYEIRDRKVILN
ncbi:FecR family protein [Gelidibacter mesophilus]|uniref:FecR family protein n=1 Tax=Gelidibacter mesophilus TaxID=169050 RepID=UPI0004115F34|nr:FecR family protein [Gelidibacter mesophilus]